MGTAKGTARVGVAYTRVLGSRLKSRLARPAGLVGRSDSEGYLKALDAAREAQKAARAVLAAKVAGLVTREFGGRGHASGHARHVVVEPLQDLREMGE